MACRAPGRGRLGSSRPSLAISTLFSTASAMKPLQWYRQWSTSLVMEHSAQEVTCWPMYLHLMQSAALPVLEWVLPLPELESPRLGGPLGPAPPLRAPLLLAPLLLAPLRPRSESPRPRHESLPSSPTIRVRAVASNMAAFPALPAAALLGLAPCWAVPRAMLLS
jgi:hypothetical protein